MKIKVLSLILFCCFSSLQAVTVYDPANAALKSIANAQDLLISAKEIAEMVKQYEHMVKQYKTQLNQWDTQKVIDQTTQQLRDFAGDPFTKKGTVDLNFFKKLVIVKKIDNLTDLTYKVTDHSLKLYEKIDHVSGLVEAPEDEFKAEKVTENIYNEYENTVKNVDSNLDQLEIELNKQMEISKNANTEIEVQRANAAIIGLKTKIDILLYKERQAANQLNAIDVRTKNKNSESAKARKQRVKIANENYKNNYKIPHFQSNNKSDDNLYSEVEF